MNKSLILAALVASQAIASDLNVGGSMVVSSAQADQPELAGIALTAEHSTEMKKNASLAIIAQGNLYPESFTKGGPKSFSTHVCGAFKGAEDSPFALHLGLGAEVIATANAEDSVMVAPSFVAGTRLAFTEGLDIEAKAMSTLPVNTQGQLGSPIVKAQFGAVYNLGIEA